MIVNIFNIFFEFPMIFSETHLKSVDKWSDFLILLRVRVVQIVYMVSVVRNLPKLRGGEVAVYTASVYEDGYFNVLQRGGSMTFKVRRFKLRHPLAMFLGSRDSWGHACYVGEKIK